MRKFTNSINARGFLGNFYLGYINGKLNNNYYKSRFSKIPDGLTNLNFHKVYVNAGIHWIGRWLELSGNAKAGKMNFYKGVINGNYFGNDLNKISKIIQKNSLPFFDYSLKAEINLTIFGLYGQFTTSHINEFKNHLCF